MPKFRKMLGAGVVAALLATSATPALARDGWRGGGWSHGGGHHGGWNGGGRGWGGHRYRRGGGDFGDFLLGALVIGGVAAVASEAIRSDRDRRYGDRDYDGRDYDGRDYGGTRDDRARGGEDAAADSCAEAVERRAGRDGDARVESIRTVAPDGDGWRVEGDVAAGSGVRPFICGVRAGAVDFVQIGESAAFR